MGRIVSVNLAVPEPNPAKGVGVTGINKRPVDHLVTAQAFRAYMTEPELLRELVEIDGLPDDLRETLAERLGSA